MLLDTNINNANYTVNRTQTEVSNKRENRSDTQTLHQSSSHSLVPTSSSRSHAPYSKGILNPASLKALTHRPAAALPSEPLWLSWSRVRRAEVLGRRPRAQVEPSVGHSFSPCLSGHFAEFWLYATPRVPHLGGSLPRRQCPMGSTQPAPGNWRVPGKKIIFSQSLCLHIIKFSTRKHPRGGAFCEVLESRSNIYSPGW